VLLAIPVLVGVATLVFALIHLVPGDPAEAMLGESAAQADLSGLRTKLGLDQPLLTQYERFVVGLATGDLGTSFRYGTPVSQEIGQRFGRTCELALVAMIVGVVIAVPLGVVGALYRDGPIDHVATTISLAGIAMPNFWLGPLLALVLGVKFGWLPISGTGSWRNLVLPALTLGAALAAMTARMTRVSLADELGELYVRAARARGLSRRRAIVVHALRNSLIPVVTIIGLQLGSVLTGTIITETIFAWPGVGRLLIQAINFRDYPLVQGCVLLIAVTYVAANLVVDVAYAWLDPRIRYRYQ
jgi:ABC-type dipeptide/oligopeptide/nickel transport system permease component